MNVLVAIAFVVYFSEKIVFNIAPLLSIILVFEQQLNVEKQIFLNFSAQHTTKSIVHTSVQNIRIQIV